MFKADADSSLRPTVSVVFSLLCRVIIDNVVFDGWSSLEWLMCRRATIGVLVGRTGVGLGARGTRLLGSQRTVVAKNVIPFRQQRQRVDNRQRRWRWVMGNGGCAE